MLTDLRSDEDRRERESRTEDGFVGASVAIRLGTVRDKVVEDSLGPPDIAFILLRLQAKFL